MLYDRRCTRGHDVVCCRLGNGPIFQEQATGSLDYNFNVQCLLAALTDHLRANAFLVDTLAVYLFGDEAFHPSVYHLSIASLSLPSTFIFSLEFPPNTFELIYLPNVLTPTCPCISVSPQTLVLFPISLDCANLFELIYPHQLLSPSLPLSAHRTLSRPDSRLHQITQIHFSWCRSPHCSQITPPCHTAKHFLIETHHQQQRP